jgi:hypothetical protein
MTKKDHLQKPTKESNDKMNKMTTIMKNNNFKRKPVTHKEIKEIKEILRINIETSTLSR